MKGNGTASGLQRSKSGAVGSSWAMAGRNEPRPKSHVAKSYSGVIFAVASLIPFLLLLSSEDDIFFIMYDSTVYP